MIRAVRVALHRGMGDSDTRSYNSWVVLYNMPNDVC